MTRAGDRGRSGAGAGTAIPAPGAALAASGFAAPAPAASSVAGAPGLFTSAAWPMRAAEKLAGVVTRVPATSMATIDAVMARAVPPTQTAAMAQRGWERTSAMASV